MSAVTHKIPIMEQNKKVLKGKATLKENIIKMKDILFIQTFWYKFQKNRSKNKDFRTD